MGFFSSIINPFKTISSSPGKALGLNDSYGALTDPIGFLTGENAAKAQNEQQLQFWNMQNAYNHPKEQMKRFAEAGLNPNLIYSQGNAGSAGAVGSAATGDAGSSVLSKASSVVAAIYGLKGLKADVANKQLSNSLLKTQTSYMKEQERRLAYETDWMKEHGTSSLDNNWIRGAKSLLVDNQTVLGDVATGLGTARGNLSLMNWKDLFSEAFLNAMPFLRFSNPKNFKSALKTAIYGRRR